MVAAGFPERLTTDRLTLRKPQMDDAAHAFARWTQDADVSRHMVWRPHTRAEQANAFFHAAIDDWAADTRRAYVITSRDKSLANGAPLGMIDARLGGTTVNVGYLLAKAFWRQGLMCEALTALAGHALDQPEIHRVEATCDVDNHGSAALLQRAGFVLEGTLRKHTVHPNLDAKPRDCLMFARVA